MSTVLPPTPLPPPQAVSLPRAIVLTAPPALAELALGTKLDVVVASLPEVNKIAVDTPLGPLTLSLPFKPVVSVGQPLILHLVGLAGKDGQAKVTVSLAEGRAAPAPSTPGTGSPLHTGSPSQASGATVPTAVRLTVGLNISATLLRPVTLSPTGQVLTTIPQTTGQPVQATPQGGTTPTTATPTTTTAPTAQTASPVAASQPGTKPVLGNAAQPLTQVTTQLPAGSGAILKIVSIRPPEGQTPSLAPPPIQGGSVSLTPGAILTGTVSGQQSVGQAIVQTHAGPVSIPTDRPLSPGTQITFELVSLRPAASSHPGVHSAQTQSPLITGSWSTLSDAVDALGDVAPGAQAHLLQTALPRADNQLMTNILFFLGAMRSGDVKNWMGDGPLRILERHKPDFAARLKDDFGQASRRINDPETGEWRQIAVPFLNDGDVENILILMRDSDGQNPDDGPGDDTRFVVDLNLSRLGHMQIDGLVGAKGKRLDVVVRTDQPLDGAMRQDIRALYANALEVTGIEGSVGFQAAPGNFVAVTERPQKSNENLIV